MSSGGLLLLLSLALSGLAERTLEDSVVWEDCGRPGYEPGPDGSCYKLHARRDLPWGQALLQCAREGAALAVANSQLEAVYLAALAAGKRRNYSQGIALGFHDLYEQGHFYTVDGAPFGVEGSGYLKWAPDMPYHGQGRCGTMNSRGKLQNVSCLTPVPYICEINLEKRKCNGKVQNASEPRMTMEPATTKPSATAAPTTTTTPATTTPTTTPTTTTNPTTTAPTTTSTTATITTTTQRPDTTTTVGAVCNESILGYRLGPDGKSCYKAHLEGYRRWGHALRLCNHEGASLALVNSPLEAAHLVSLAGRQPVALGFHGLYAAGHFFTVDGTPLAESGYAVWAPGEPDDGRCGAMDGMGQLIDIDCLSPVPFVCEIVLEGDCDDPEDGAGVVGPPKDVTTNVTTISPNLVSDDTARRLSQ